MPSHVVLDRVMADHPGRSRGGLGLHCAIIWRAKPAGPTGHEPTFRRSPVAGRGSTAEERYGKSGPRAKHADRADGKGGGL